MTQTQTHRRCSRCHEEKAVSFFSKKRDGFQKECKDCRRIYARSHYQVNKEAYKRRARESNKDQRARSYRLIYDHLKSNPCVDCGQNDVFLLEFDHVRGEKRAGVRELAGHGIEAVKEEINKCEVRCKKCHVIVTCLRQGVEHYFLKFQREDGG